MQKLDVFGLIDRARALEQRVSVALLYSGLRMNQYRALECIQREGKVTVTDLGREFGITRASASLMVNDLIGQGVLVAVENPDDRRSFFLKLTQAGRNKFEVGRRDLALVLESISGDWDEETIQLLNRFIGGKP